MNKRLMIIVSCCSLIAVSVVLLLVFLLMNNNNKDKPLYCSAKDINISVGKVVYDYYDISNKNASISITVSRSDVIDINKEMIRGKTAGQVTVTLTATLGKEKSSTSFYVKVYDNSYRVEITSVENCNIEGNTIYVQSNPCQFKVDLYDVLNEKISNINFRVTAECDADVIVNFSTIMLTLNSASTIKIDFYDLDFVVTLSATFL